MAEDLYRTLVERGLRGWGGSDEVAEECEIFDMIKDWKAKFIWGFLRTRKSQIS